MSNNFYWNVYKNLEREFISLSELIHIDDEQLKIYSIKISELLIRTVVEVESISKYLYFENGGTKEDDNNLFFDTDCIGYLENQWLLSKKQIIVSAQNVYFNSQENKILTPLNKANKRGTSSAHWLQAYQAVKHDRVNSLKKGNLKNLIQAMAGLYLLNIYYKDQIHDLGKDGTGMNFDESLGSNIFSVKTHFNILLKAEYSYDKKDDFDECVYLIHINKDSGEELAKIIKNIVTETNANIQAELEKELMIKYSSNKTIPEANDIKILAEKLYPVIAENTAKNIAYSKSNEFNAAKEKLLYEAVLNKQQF